MSFFDFNLVGNAIDAFQQAANVTSNNIANVATPGASRQVATITEQIPVSGSPYFATHLGLPGTQGEGAVVQQIARIHQDSYDTLYRGANSSQNYYATEQTQLSGLQSNFGEPNNGVNSAFGALQSAISNLSASPTSVAVRQSVLIQAGDFATALNNASTAIVNQKTGVIAGATSAVEQANTLIDQIASLNGQIRSLVAVGDSPNTYLDQRDAAIDSLSQIVNVTSSAQPNGSTLVSVDGRPLVNDTIGYHLAPPVIGTSANGTPTFTIGMANDPNPSNPAPVPLGSGQLGALVDVYNNKLVPYGAQLDNFASASADEINRITQSSVDLNGNPGAALFTKSAGQATIDAGSISVAITDPTTLPIGLVSTAAGTLTTPMNSSNNTVSTSDPVNGLQTLSNPPPAAGIVGDLTVSVDGITQTFAYDTGGNATTIGDFMLNFNAGHFGVTASFDPSTEKIVFARDPNNTDVVHRALQGANPATAGFTITDSNAGTAGPDGTPATSILQMLGAAAIDGVVQTPANAYGTADNAGANALTTLFSDKVGVGALQTTVAASSSATAGTVTLTQPSTVPGPYDSINVGQVLTVVDPVAQTSANVTVTAVDRIKGTITVASPVAIAAGDAITTARTQTLGGAYQELITQMGLDTATATTGSTTQAALTSSIDAARQSVDGINIDEETQNLLKYQSAYTAAAKTLSSLNSLMQTTLGLISGG